MYVYKGVFDIRSRHSAYWPKCFDRNSRRLLFTHIVFSALLSLIIRWFTMSMSSIWMHFAPWIPSDTICSVLVHVLFPSSSASWALWWNPLWWLLPGGEFATSNFKSFLPSSESKPRKWKERIFKGWRPISPFRHLATSVMLWVSSSLFCSISSWLSFPQSLTIQEQDPNSVRSSLPLCFISQRKTAIQRNGVRKLSIEFSHFQFVPHTHAFH
jgi:hypothetical protein